MDLNTEMPPWLQRNLAPGNHDSPWLLDAFKTGMALNEQRQKLPLQIQEMELQNKAHKLAVDHQGMVNDQLNDEMDNYNEDLETLRASLSQAAKTPGGSIAMQAPTFRSKKAQEAWRQQQIIDAQTSYGQALHQRVIEESKIATEAMGLVDAPILRPRADGTFDPDELQDAASKLRAYKEHEKLKEIEARTAWHSSIGMGGNSTIPENASPVKDKDGNIIAYGVPNGRGGIRYITPPSNSVTTTMGQIELLEKERADAEGNQDWDEMDRINERISMFKRALPGAAQATHLSDVDRMELSSLHRHKNMLEEMYQKLKPEEFPGGKEAQDEAFLARRLELVNQIDRTNKKINSLSGRSKPQTSRPTPPAGPMAPTVPQDNATKTNRFKILSVK